ncbi:GTPase [Streptomyces sp. G45]|uniref:GTPase n=1 Tax=Streptomyces sp. G45 TaxID=3406627 RepID=UPI003C1EC998
MSSSYVTHAAQHDLAEQVALLADRAGADSAAAAVRRAYRRAGAPLARICVVGGANVGKSRLVNALVGVDCVPVSVHPVLAPPVAVRAAGTGPVRAGAEDPHTVLADVPADSWLARAAVELVDTPGWEDWRAAQGADGQDRHPLARIVTDCDAVVVVTEARRALLATERARVRALAAAPHSPPLAVVVAKLDEVGDEAGDVLRRVRHAVREAAPEAQVLPGPLPTPERSDHVEQCRAALTRLTGAHQRAVLRAGRRLRSLVATCDLVAEASERALADVRWSDPVRDRAARTWHAAHEGARFHWVVIASDLDDRRAALTAAIAAEAGRRRARLGAELAKELAELAGSPEDQGFVRLRVVPQTELALHDFEAWCGEAVDRALAEDTRWLRAALLDNRPGEDLFRDLVAPRAGEALPPVSLPGAATAARAAEADEAAGWDASWLPEFVATAIEGVLAPVATGTVARIAGAAGSALVTEALEHGQAQRLERTIAALERVVAAAFTEHTARTEERVGQVYGRLAAQARDRDEQWWRLHTAALTARPGSLDHWRTLRDEARHLRGLARTHLSGLEGA